MVNVIRVLTVLFFLFIVLQAIGQKKKINVLSYYAVNNTIDGQPKVDQINVLRFYPVFAFRSVTEEVKITVYYAGEVYRREAIANSDSLYWEAKLPDFRLGESIQRYEVETRIRLELLEEYWDKLEEYKSSYTDIIDDLNKIEDKIDPVYWNNLGNSVNSSINSIKEKKDVVISSLSSFIQDKNQYSKEVERIQKYIKTELKDNLQQLLVQMRGDTTHLDSLLGKPGAYNNTGKIHSDTLRTRLILIREGLKLSYQDYYREDTIFIKKAFDSLKNALPNFNNQRILDALANSKSRLRSIFESHDPPFGSIDTLQRIASEQDSTEYNEAYEKTKKALGLYWNSVTQRALPQDSVIAELKMLKDSIWAINGSDLVLIKQAIDSNLQQAIDPIRGVSLELNVVQGKIREMNGFNFSAESLNELMSGMMAIRDTVKVNLIEELTDTKFSGIDIQKSDIVLGDSLKWAKILYRNYKLKNRDLPALDPGEELGVFRLRYIPFPVVGNQLAGPARSGFPIVFEAGVAFGNRTIVSNELFDPAFSARKLGIAVAFTPKFFSDDAEILALVLTYDFNTYASIGVGANFGMMENGKTPNTYFSLGINQRVFQELTQAIKNVFNQ